ncbi:MAG TPA: hypothetical protein VE053_06755 [Allosphingosinicella sp.]|nr:hypothetical protein [Allosphingosinicella sp.]
MSEERVTEIEAFRVGPASRGITERDVDEAVTSYNARAETGPAPLVLGHPQSDDPAKGLIARARRDGSKLYLGLKNIAADVVEAVRGGKYINRSIKFWHPTDPANPTPGKWDIRHLGLLGASAPGIPDMARLSFSADESEIEGVAPAAALVVEFAAGTELLTIIEGGPTVADKDTVPKTEFDAAVTERDRLQSLLDAAASKAETDRKAANVAFVADRVKEGRVLPGHSHGWAEILNNLPAAEVQFDAETKCAPADWLKGLLSAAQPQIIFEALSPSGEKNGGPLSADQITAQARKLVEDGKAVSFEAAVATIESKQGA